MVFTGDLVRFWAKQEVQNLKTVFKRFKITLRASRHIHSHVRA